MTRFSLLWLKMMWNIYRTRCTLSNKFPSINEAFNLSKKKVNFELDLQQDAYVRLNALYHISKLLSEFGSIENTFPILLTSAAKTFPLLTAVLIDSWESQANEFNSSSSSHANETISIITLCYRWSLINWQWSAPCNRKGLKASSKHTVGVSR